MNIMNILHYCNDAAFSFYFQVVSCLPCCSCRLEESSKIDGIDRSLLEEVEITCYSGSHEQMELVGFLSCSAGILKRLVINDRLCRWPKEAHEKIVSCVIQMLKLNFMGFVTECRMLVVNVMLRSY